MRPQFERNKVNMASVIGVLLVITAVVGDLRQTFGQTTEYTVLELTSGGVPHRLNNSGDVAGSKAESPSGEIRATIWNHGNSRPRNLGKLEGGEYSSASGINSAREVAGAGNIAGSIVPFLWTPGNGLRRIPLLAGDDAGEHVHHHPVLRHRARRRIGDEIADAVGRLVEEALDDAHNFWVVKKKDDAIKMSKDALAKAESLEDLLKKSSPDRGTAVSSRIRFLTRR